MARKKVKLEWIANDSARKTTFKKRKKGLMKKISELSTLCDIKACMIIYGPNDPNAEVWPSMPDAIRVLGKLKRLPEMEKSKKMMNQEALLRQRIMKLQEQIKKHNKENKELETNLLMHQCLAGRSLQDVGIEEVTALAWLTEMKLNKVREVLKCRTRGMTSKVIPEVKIERAIKTVPEVKIENLNMDEAVLTKEKTAMEIAVEEMRRENWFAETMDHTDLMFLKNRGSFLQALDMKDTWPDTFFSLGNL